MRTCDRSRGVEALALGALLAASAGCGSDTARYAPSADVARKSLETALTAWRDGRPDRVDRRGHDSWSGRSTRAGSRREARGVPGHSTRERTSSARKESTVRLTMKVPRGEKEARYVVHGRDPVWVYRGEDFARAMDMDNQPEPPRARRPTISTRSPPRGHPKWPFVIPGDFQTAVAQGVAMVPVLVPGIEVGLHLFHEFLNGPAPVVRVRRSAM